MSSPRASESRRGLTRREIAVSAVSVGSLFAQESTPKPTADDELAAARAGVKRTAEELRRFRVGIGVEPSFVFKP